MLAVEAGDMAAAQEMVDEAAKAVGYVNDGSPRSVRQERYADLHKLGRSPSLSCPTNQLQL